MGKTAAQGFDLAEAVDQHQLHAIGQRLAQYGAGLGNGLRVQAAGLGGRTQVLRQLELGIAAQIEQAHAFVAIGIAVHAEHQAAHAPALGHQAAGHALEQRVHVVVVIGVQQCGQRQRGRGGQGSHAMAVVERLRSVGAAQSAPVLSPGGTLSRANTQGPPVAALASSRACWPAAPSR